MPIRQNKQLRKNRKSHITKLMKRFSLIITILFLVAVFTLPASASTTTNPGVKPGSFFYFFDITFERVNLFFTFNPENKARKALGYADERLAEAEAVANENKPEAVATAMVNYQENVSLAITESEKIENREKAGSLLSTIADNTSRHQETLAEVYNKVPNEAKKAIEKAIEVSIKGHEEALKEIRGLKKTVEELQKDIELLKRQGQSDQSKEIEVLRKEVETLKSQQSPQSTKPQPLTKLINSQIIGKIKPATVYIETQDGAGSGMIFTTDGYVLTNAHVVKGYSSVDISISSGETLSGKVVGRDEEADLAVIKIASEKTFSKVNFGDSSKTEQGEEVFTLGFPFGIKGDVSFKEGTISRRIEGYFETSAEIHPGNSGGPLVNRYGQVIGVNTAIYGKSVAGLQLGETIKLAIPINTAKNLIVDLKAGSNKVVQKIYEIIPLGDISTLPLEDQVTSRKIYEEFLQTPGLQYMTPEEQSALLDPKLKAYVLEREEQKRREIEAQNAQLRREIEAQQAKNAQMNSITADCNQRMNAIDSQILAVRQKYYADVEGLGGQAVSTVVRNRQIQALADAANFEIQKLGNQRESIRIDCLNKLNALR